MRRSKIDVARRFGKWAMVEQLENRTLLSGAPGIAYGPDKALSLGYTPQLSSTSRTTSKSPTTSKSSILPPPQTHLIITPTFDSTITSDANAATIESTINAAIQVYENYFSDPITVAIDFQEMGSGLGQSSTYRGTISYTSYLSALKSHETTTNDTTAIASLPSITNNPANGNSSVFVTTANLRALGFSASPPGGFDSTIGLNTSICNLTRTSINPNNYDLMAVASHEIDEALGIGSELSGSANNVANPTGAIYGEDLYRYAAPGVRGFDTLVGSTAYFSIDGGNTNLAQFNQLTGGDFNDWYSYYGVVTPQVQDAFSSPGSTPNLNVELTQLDVLGYTPIVSIPAITTQPVSQSASAGNIVTLNSTANGSPTPQIQWQVSTNGGTSYSNIAGATANSYSFTAATGQNGNLFRAIFTNYEGTVTSQAATLTVTATASLDLQPYQVSGWSAPLVLSAVSGNHTGATTFTSSQSLYLDFAVANFGPSATTGTFFLYVLEDGAVVAGFPISAGLPANNLTGAQDYPFGTLTPGTHSFQLNVNYGNRIAETNVANDIYSATITVTATAAAATVLAQPQSQSIPSGLTASFTAIATGSPAPTEQWQVSTNGGSSYSPISGATSATYSVSAAAALNGNLYRAVFTNASGPVNSSAATLTVTSALPDLVPYTPGGWSGPLVLSTTSGVFTNAATIAANQTVYVDTALTNSGA
ncbi:MAG TPA: NF038122 family metalloprotease, partial [Humisphaera sp.]|nr:NF038122 family metalloprotease [Humisphaera sp.]